MGLIPVAAAEDYAESLRSLYPEGQFWDDQFNDPSSDLSMWCAAKAEELHRFKVRRAELLEEGFKDKTSELVENWEAVYSIKAMSSDLAERRAALVAKSGGSINTAMISKLSQQYGATLVSITFPLKPTFFGRARYKTRFSGPYVYNYILLTFVMPEQVKKELLETAVEAALIANLIISYSYRSE